MTVKNLSITSSPWFTGTDDDLYCPNDVLPMKPYRSTIDLLECSALAYRLYPEQPTNRYDLFNRALTGNSEIKSQITDSDRLQAELISEYFYKKIVWNTLKYPVIGVRDPDDENSFTFNERVIEFLSGDRKQCTRKAAGMIYRLPEFYDFDKQLQNMRNEHKLDLSDDRVSQNEFYLENTEVTPLLTQHRKTRGCSEYWYWVKSTQFKIPVLLKTDTFGGKSTGSVWKLLFNTVNQLSITGKFTLHNYFGDFDYLECNKWSVDSKFFEKIIDERFKRAK